MIQVKIYAEDHAVSRRVGGDGTFGSGTPLQPIEGRLLQMPDEGTTIFIDEGWAGLTVARSYMTLNDPVGQVSVETIGWSDEDLLGVGFKVVE